MDIKLLLVEDDPNLAYIIRSGLRFLFRRNSLAGKVFNRKFAREKLYLRNIMFEKHNNRVKYGICRQEGRTTSVGKGLCIE